MKTPFEIWIESDEGKKCNDASQFIKQPYLQNRLWRAFHNGLSYGRSENGLHQQIKELEYDLQQKKNMIKKLTKIKRP